MASGSYLYLFMFITLLTQGFLSSLGMILLAGVAPYLVLSLLIAYGWLGYVLALSVFLVPFYLIVRGREKHLPHGGEFDDKKFSEKALDEYLKVVKRQDVES
jgi:hypothetical protein